MARGADLAGMRFGKLTVKERLPKKQDGYYLWRCRCDCGGEVLANTKRLRRGTVTNCGCLPKTTAQSGPKAEDLTGRQFGQLTVLCRAKNKNGRTCWTCRCSCGTLCDIPAKQLKAGATKSCGCQQHPKSRGIVDLTGERFGRLTVLGPTDQRSQKGSVFWRCRCDCGTELAVTEDNLVYGHYRSCGCLQREIQRDIVHQLHHIDGTCVEWLEKRKYRCDNTSGFRGVYPMKNGRYRVMIGFKRQKFFVGTYATFERAVQARLEAEELIHDGFLQAYYQWDEQGRDGPLIFEVRKENGAFVVQSD